MFSKLVPISGDISLPELGLSLADLQMLSGNVTIVFHTAARIKFDNDLRGAIDSNVKGPQKVVSFCRQLKQLKVSEMYPVFSSSVIGKINFLFFLGVCSRVDGIQ